MKTMIKKLSDISKIHHRAAFTDVLKHTSPKHSHFLKLSEERYSCREFKAIPVPEELISMILRSARHAPSAMNKQPVHIWVVKSPGAMDKLKNATAYLYGAPVVFMVGYKPSEAWVRKYDGKNGAETDAAIAGTHIMMEAADVGLGCTWVGSFDPAAIASAFPETGGWEIEALFPVGYPAGKPSDKHGQRKSLEELTSEL